MAKNDAWLPLYVGDYLADTQHLSTAEHGAYLLLLMHGWRHGSIPDDDAALARIVGLRLDHWRKMSAAIRAFHQPDGNGGLVQKRLEAERAKSAKRSEARTVASQSRWRNSGGYSPELATSYSEPKPLENNECGDANASVLDAFCIVQSQSHIHPSTKKEILGTCPTPVRVRSAPLTGFDEFWALYPRKVGKGYARKAWPRAVRAAGSPDEIIVGLRVLLHTLDMREGGRFCPHPATWLNAERWADLPDGDES